MFNFKWKPKKPKLKKPRVQLEIKETPMFSRYYSPGQRTFAEKSRRKRNLFTAITVAAIILIFILGYFITTLLLDISALPPIK